jgi:hypothetical protein
MTLTAFLRAGVCRFHARHPRRQVRMGGNPQAHAHQSILRRKPQTWLSRLRPWTCTDRHSAVHSTDGMEDQQGEEEKELLSKARDFLLG